MLGAHLTRMWTEAEQLWGREQESDVEPTAVRPGTGSKTLGPLQPELSPRTGPQRGHGQCCPASRSPGHGHCLPRRVHSEVPDYEASVLLGQASRPLH